MAESKQDPAVTLAPRVEAIGDTVDALYAIAEVQDARLSILARAVNALGIAVILLAISQLMHGGD